MKLLDKIRDAFGFAPRLRNKPGGMALIRVADRDWLYCGANAINGFVVKTKSHVDGHWLIEPKPEFLASRNFHHKGMFFPKGALLVVAGLDDKNLEPLPEVGDDAVDEMVLLVGKPQEARAKEPA